MRSRHVQCHRCGGAMEEQCREIIEYKGNKKSLEKDFYEWREVGYGCGESFEIKIRSVGLNIQQFYSSDDAGCEQVITDKILQKQVR
jgi:hypothetical protein